MYVLSLGHVDIVDLNYKLANPKTTNFAGNSKNVIGCALFLAVSVELFNLCAVSFKISY